MSHDVTCTHCGSPLSPDGDQPCPVCGKTGRHICASISDGVSMRDDLAIRSTDGRTGRSALHSDTANPTDTVQIQASIDSFVNGDPRALEKCVSALVQGFGFRLDLDNRRFFRGVSTAARCRVVGRHLGPSPQPRDGRYNERGEQCIYLIDDWRFLPVELGTNELLVQEYLIPVDRLRIADLSAANTELSNGLALVFQMTERGRTSSGFEFERELVVKGKSRYAVSQTVARAFKQRRWQGMYIPGVHGTPGDTYRNLALFADCVKDWEEWTVGDYREFGGQKA